LWWCVYDRRDKEVVGVFFVRFRAPLHLNSNGLFNILIFLFIINISATIGEWVWHTQIFIESLLCRLEKSD
jgi:hypothetical protein